MLWANGVLHKTYDRGIRQKSHIYQEFAFQSESGIFYQAHTSLFLMGGKEVID
jgi:hypothetical protein